MKQLKIIMLSLFLVGIFSCKKEMNHPDINRFKTALIQQDVKTFASEVSKTLGNYSEAGIEESIARISEIYGVTSELVCFNCIKTLPPATEVKFSWMQNGILIEKIVDLSYDSRNRIVVVGIHD